MVVCFFLFFFFFEEMLNNRYSIHVKVVCFWTCICLDRTGQDRTGTRIMFHVCSMYVPCFHVSGPQKYMYLAGDSYMYRRGPLEKHLKHVCGNVNKDCDESGLNCDVFVNLCA